MWFGLFDKRTLEQKEKDRLMHRREEILSEMEDIHTQYQFASVFFRLYHWGADKARIR